MLAGHSLLRLAVVQTQNNMMTIARCILLIGLLHTAPTLQAALSNSDEGSLTRGIGDSSPPAIGTPPNLQVLDPSNPQTKTIELLLQMQNQTGNAGETQPARKPGEPTAAVPLQPQKAASAAAGKAAPAEPNPLISLKEAILGQAVPKSGEVAERDVSRDEVTTHERTNPAGGTTSVQKPRSSAEPSGPGLLSHPIVRFVRENRGLVIGGSLLALAVVWLTANYPFGRGSRR